METVLRRKSRGPARRHRWSLSVVVAAAVCVALTCACPTGPTADYFDGELEFREHGPGKMELLKPFAYIDPGSRRWEAKQGYVTDGASIPQVFWSVVGSPFTGEYLRAAVIHDWYCDAKTERWQDVHRTFYHASLRAGVGEVKAAILYAAVYHFGPRWPEGGAEAAESYPIGRVLENLAAGAPESDDTRRMGYDPTTRSLVPQDITQRVPMLADAAADARGDLVESVRSSALQRGDLAGQEAAAELSQVQDRPNLFIAEAQREIERSGRNEGSFMEVVRAQDELENTLARRSALVEQQKSLFMNIKTFVELQAPSLDEIETYRFE